MPISTITRCPYCNEQISVDTEKLTVIFSADGPVNAPCDHLVYSDLFVGDARNAEQAEHPSIKQIRESENRDWRDLLQTDLDNLLNSPDCVDVNGESVDAHEIFETEFQVTVANLHNSTPDGFFGSGGALFSIDPDAFAKELAARYAAFEATN